MLTSLRSPLFPFAPVAVAAVLCGALATPAEAQVNTENMRLGEERAGLSGFTELLFAIKDGNTNRVGFGGGFRLQHALLESTQPSSDEAEGSETEESGDGEAAEPDSEEGRFRTQRLIFWVTQTSFAEEDEETSENNAFSHLRYVRRVKPRVQFESFLQWEEDEFQRLDTRWLAGVGARFGLIEKPHRELFFGTGYMYESEELDLAAGDPAEADTETHRLTSYLTLKVAGPAGNLALVNTLYVQPDIEEFGDFRALNEAHLEVALTERLALNLALVVRHDSEPPLGVEETDISLTNRFRYSF